MLKSKSYGLGIFSLAFLWGCAVAMASEPEDASRERESIIRALEILRGSSCEEEKKEARKLLHPKGIIPEAFYTQEDIDRAWSDDWLPVTQSVVHLSATEVDKVPHRLWETTGTLIDVGILGLEGRVVVTCAHAALPHFSDFLLKKCFPDLQNEEDAGEERFLDRYGCPIVSVNSQDLGHFSRSDSGCFQLGENNPSIKFTALAEYQPGQPMDPIPFTDIYVLTENNGADCCDVAVAILEKPVEFKGKIVPGIEFDQLNVIADSIAMEEEHPFHMYLDGSPDRLPMNRRPMVVGYGYTGVTVEMSIFLMGKLNLSEEQQRIFFGLGIKKAIVLDGLDLNGKGFCQNMKGCSCARNLYDKMGMSLNLLEESLRTNVGDIYCSRTAKCLQKAKEAQTADGKKIHFDEAKKWLRFAKNNREYISRWLQEAGEEIEEIEEKLRLKKSFYAEPRCADGFSGSLVLRKSGDGSGNYDVFGIYSGPQFTDKIKNFMVNAVDHQRQLPKQ